MKYINNSLRSRKKDSTIKKNTSAKTTPTNMKDNANLELYDQDDSSSCSGGSIYNKEKGLRSPILLPMKRLRNENSSSNNHTFPTFEYNNNNDYIPEAVTSSLPAAHIQSQSQHQQQYPMVRYQEERFEEKEIDTNHHNHDQLESNNNQSKDRGNELPYSLQTQSHVQPQPNEETYESVTKKIVELTEIQKELNMQKIRKYEEQELSLLQQLSEVRKKKQKQEEEALNHTNFLLEILKTHENTHLQLRGPPCP